MVTDLIFHILILLGGGPYINGPCIKFYILMGVVHFQRARLFFQIFLLFQNFFGVGVGGGR
jgi:hypothetical protein